MSRSFRHYPVAGFTTAKSEKWDKTRANKSLRRIVKQNIEKEEYQVFTIRCVSDVWDFNKDGKMAFDPAYHPELMRK